jgi:uncharacterized protein (DUF983 family)
MPAILAGSNLRLFGMTKQLPKRSPANLPESSLNYQGVYTCPVCRHGQISALTLTEAFACNFCHHIFTANLQKQQIQVADSSQPMAWRWTGNNWKNTRQGDGEVTAVLWILSVALITLPAFLVWLSAHTFPPADGSRFSWVPTAWIGLTLLSHLLFVGWLIAEVYQFPLYAVLKVKLRQLLRR